MTDTPSIEQLLDYQKKHPNKLFPTKSEPPRKATDIPRTERVVNFQRQNPGQMFVGPAATPDQSVPTPRRLLYYQKENPGKIFTGPENPLDRPASSDRQYSTDDQRRSKDDSLTAYTSQDQLPGPLKSREKSPREKDRELLRKSNAYLKPQQVPIWSASKPESILLYRPVKGDDIEKLKKLASAIGEWYPGNSQICAITTIEKHPHPLQNWKEDDPHGLSVLFMPKGQLDLKVEICYKNHYLDIDLKWVMPIRTTQSTRVATLKQEIEKLEGFPVQQQDLLFKNQCFQNERRLYTYHLNDNEPIQMILQPRYDLSLTVQTFWKKEYTLQLDRCARLHEVIAAVLWELFLDKGSKQTRFLVQSLIRQNILCMEYQGYVMPNANGIMLYKVQNGSFLNLWPVNRDLNLLSQIIEIKMDYDGRHEFQVPAAPSDTWMIVAMKAFKFTKIPIDMMKLITKDRTVDLSTAIGFNETNRHHVTIVVNVDFSRRQYEFNQVEIRFPSGVKKRLHFNATDSVADIKHYLACMGFHLAKYYTFFIGDRPLKDAQVISGLTLKESFVVDLELEIFPIFVHLQGVEFTVLEEHQLTTLENLRKGVFHQINTEENPYNMLVHCGQVLPNDFTPLFKTTIGANSVFFIETVPQYHSLEFRTHNNKMFNLTIPRSPTGEVIWDVVKKCKYLYDNSKYAVVLLINWLLIPRAKKEDGPIMLLHPRPRPRRKDPLKPKQLDQKIWAEHVKVLMSRGGKEFLDSNNLPQILDSNEASRRRKLKEWPYETVQPRWVKFPPLPSQTDTTNDKKKIKFRDLQAKQLMGQPTNRRYKVKMYNVGLQVDMDKYEQQEGRQARKKKQLMQDHTGGQTRRMFRSREEREAFERAQLEAEGLAVEALEEEGENADEETPGADGKKEGEPANQGKSGEGAQETSERDGTGDPQEKGVTREGDGQGSAEGEGSHLSKKAVSPSESAQRERAVDASGRQAPQAEGQQSGRGGGATTRSRRAPQASKAGTANGGASKAGTANGGASKAGTANGDSSQPKSPPPQEKPTRRPPQSQRGEGLTRAAEQPENVDEEGAAPPTADNAPKKTVSIGTLLALQKKLRQRRQTLGLVIHTRLTENVGMEYELKDKLVVDRCQDTSEDEETSFMRILQPREIRVAVYEPLDAAPAKPKQMKSILKKVKFEDEVETKGYWRPVLPVVNCCDNPIWEYRPTFQEQMALTEQVEKALEEEQMREQMLQEDFEAKEKKARERDARQKRAKKHASAPKENKANFELVSKGQQAEEQPRDRGEDFAQPAQRPATTEETENDVIITLDNPQQSNYKQVREQVKRQWMDIETVPEYEKRREREREREKAKEKERARQSNGAGQDDLEADSQIY